MHFLIFGHCYVLVQEDTACVLRQLQAVSGHVLGLTARDRALVPLTLRQLDGLGIHFQEPGHSAVQPVELGARVMLASGIVFCSNQSKREALRRYLESVALPSRGGARNVHTSH